MISDLGQYHSQLPINYECKCLKAMNSDQDTEHSGALLGRAGGFLGRPGVSVCRLIPTKERISKSCGLGLTE